MATKARASRRRRGSWRRYLTVGNMIIGGSILASVAFLLLLVISGQANQPPDINIAGVVDNSVIYPIQSRDHIEVGSPHPAYNSNPPTGGWHYASAASLGVYEAGLPDETLVHNLEHGHIWLSYSDANDQEALDLLRQLRNDYRSWVIVTYRPETPTRIAAAAWGRLLTLDDLDSDQLYAFIERYHNRAPESIPGSNTSAM